MKFLVATALVAMLTPGASAIARRRHVQDVTFVQTLPDERPESVSDEEIAEHEAARAEAAKVAVNPANEYFAQVRHNLDQINKDMSFGISYSQRTRNEHARDLCTATATLIKDYADDMISKTESGPNETLTEQNAHNIAASIFFDVQLQDFMAGLGMAADDDLILAVNRLKSLQKLYLFEQKGGEDYLG